VQHWAAFHGLKGLVNTLIAHGVLLDAREKGSGEAALHLAASAGHQDIVESLIKAGASVDLPEQSTLWTPLCYAASKVGLAPRSPDQTLTDVV
jgi:ankyrin repeat protein